MSPRLTRLSVKNFRSLENVSIPLKGINVLFGPNGAGKSNFLDTIWFLRDCAIRGVDVASSDRSHGIGALWDGADEGARISIQIENDNAIYEVLFGYSSGRIEPFVGEKLTAKDEEKVLIDRKVGSDKATFYHHRMKEKLTVPLRDAEKLALTRYLDLDDTDNEATDIDRVLRFIHFYHCRETDLYNLKKRGSETSHHFRLWDRCQNLWSVLRNLHDREKVDDRFDTILDYMRRCFPSFRGVLIEPTGPNVVYGSFIECGRRHAIHASGVSDGHLQMLALLTALFSEGKGKDSLLIFDEPEISFHPHALAIFAEAIREAARDWDKQILMATHSPVLISQFEPCEILATETGERGETVIRAVDQIEEAKDLLLEYAAGSLYMAEVLAPQSKSLVADNP